jgi:ABC-2 type transport system ATP-binding protein
MARRIGLAQALINNPDLILLDEPTTGLDPIGTREMKDLILDLKRQGKTVLLCSHLLADVQDVCDRITILFKGRMQTVGEVRDLLQVRDITQIQTRHLTAEQVQQVEQFMERIGARETAVTHPTTTLEDLFMRIVRENTAASAGTATGGSPGGGDGTAGSGDSNAPGAGTGAADRAANADSVAKV